MKRTTGATGGTRAVPPPEFRTFAALLLLIVMVGAWLSLHTELAPAATLRRSTNFRHQKTGRGIAPGQPFAKSIRVSGQVASSSTIGPLKLAAPAPTATGLNLVSPR